jgi:hypothetical protein
VRLRLFLVLSLAVLLVVACTVIIFEQFQNAGEANPGLTGAVTSSTDGANTAVVPAEGQVAIRGTVRAVHLEGAVLDPRSVPTPFTITSERGFGNGGEITGVTVGKEPASVVWDGGRPFVLASGGSMVLDPVVADLVPDGIRLSLAGVHAIAPGTYQLDTPVAVGRSGVATSRDAVTFTATSGSTFEATGDTALLLDHTAPRHFVGPGKVHLEGTFALTLTTGVVAPGDAFDLDAGAFDLTFTPTATGWDVTGVADADVVPTTVAGD